LPFKIGIYFELVIFCERHSNPLIYFEHLKKESSESDTEENDAQTLKAVRSFLKPNIPQNFHHPQISPGFYSAGPASVSTSEGSDSESLSSAPFC
jgi:hypothetical protein